ncbi:AAA family ATPase [Arenimonas sp.]|uniref:AAA family ATPase n=1 Tax=Arenimonas sp. TaxID=1872635 RepID=UPI0039E62A23
MNALAVDDYDLERYGRPDTVEERAKVLAAAQEMTLADEIAELMRKRTPSDLEAAKKPHPHLFRLGDSAAFPRAEVSILAGPGREGKTSAIIAIAVNGALGLDLGNQPCEHGAFSTIIVSAEDSVEQYDAKLEAQLRKLSPKDQRTVLDNVRIIDLESIKRRVGPLVLVQHGEVMRNVALVDSLIDAAQRPLDGNSIDGEWDAPLGWMVLETVSTLSDAAEDNVGLRVFADAAKQIARSLGIAVSLAHHTSQASALNLSTLNVSQADIRGGTALIGNTRQTWLLVNLGSEDDPFGEKDARTHLRQMIAPGIRSRISALICLDSSKSLDPPPVFFAWDHTRQEAITPPAEYRGMHWRKLHRQIGSYRAEAADEVRTVKQQDDVRKVVAVVERLESEGRQPTVRAVSDACGRSPAWARRPLVDAVYQGDLQVVDEAVPHTRGLTPVYRLKVSE